MQNSATILRENLFNYGSDRWQSKALEIPLLLKAHFLSQNRNWRPFLSAGAAIRRVSTDSSFFSSTFNPNSANPGISAPPIDVSSVGWNVDPVVGAGITLRSGNRLQIEPQVRYSYWHAGRHSHIRQNQVYFMFGLRF